MLRNEDVGNDQLARVLVFGLGIGHALASVATTGMSHLAPYAVQHWRPLGCAAPVRVLRTVPFAVLRGPEFAPAW